MASAGTGSMRLGISCPCSVRDWIPKRLVPGRPGFRLRLGVGAGPRVKVFGPILDPLTPLAFLTGSTTRIKLDTSVLVLSYRRPLPLTNVASSFDVLSGR